jgi:hypothetical protein
MGRHITVFFGIIIAFIVAGLYGFRSYTKSFSPEGEANLTTRSGFIVNINYSRPYQKNRKLFGFKDALAPFGKVWRTGANEATEIEISHDVEIYGQKLRAGRYTLFTIPNEITWMVIFNNELNQWGDFNYDSSKDELRVAVPAFVVKTRKEMFTLEVREKPDGAEIRLLWGDTMVTIPMVVN